MSKKKQLKKVNMRKHFSETCLKKNTSKRAKCFNFVKKLKLTNKPKKVSVKQMCGEEYVDPRMAYKIRQDLDKKINIRVSKKKGVNKKNPMAVEFEISK